MRPPAWLAALMALALAAPAVASPADLCRAAAQAAADRHGIPRDILQAITLVETRRKVAGVSGPWPWTLNVEGQGFWFETPAEALAAAEAAIARGQTSTDLGCFQLNYRWHGQAFAGPAAMLDPATAADYAARFLRDLHGETGDWLAAAGHYHSRTDVHATRYRGMIATALTGLGHLPDLPPPPVVLAEAAPGPRAARPHEGTRGGTERATASLWSGRSVPGAAPPGAVGLAALGGPRASLFAPKPGDRDG